MAKRPKFDVLSPDGFPIHCCKTYRSRRSALLAAKKWAKRFEWQGFYSTARWERIPLNEIVDRCRIIDLSEDE